MTRSKTRHNRTKKQIYRKRVKNSKCRGIRARSCNKKASCKYASGSKRRFCRKKSNRSA